MPRPRLLLPVPGGRGGGGRALPVPALLYDSRLRGAAESNLRSVARLLLLMSVALKAFSLTR